MVGNHLRMVIPAVYTMSLKASHASSTGPLMTPFSENEHRAHRHMAFENLQNVQHTRN